MSHEKQTFCLIGKKWPHFRQVIDKKRIWMLETSYFNFFNSNLFFIFADILF